jgi:hypothetical protein
MQDLSVRLERGAGTRWEVEGTPAEGDSLRRLDACKISAGEDPCVGKLLDLLFEIKRRVGWFQENGWTEAEVPRSGKERGKNVFNRENACRIVVAAHDQSHDKSG